MNETDANNLEGTVAEALGDAGARLEAALVELARSLRPFPAFMGMVSVQAIELEPPFKPLRDLGCVVVDPEGRICQLDLTSVGGLAGVIEADQVEEFQHLELTPLEYLVYAETAIGLVSEELRRRGR